MPREIIATYYTNSTFEVPDDIFLLSIEENKKCKPNEIHVGMWYIRWGVLHYIDEHGEEQTIEPVSEDTDYKKPQEIEMTITHTCKSCDATLTNEQFEYGTMCCDKPMFHDDHDE